MTTGKLGCLGFPPSLAVRASEGSSQTISFKEPNLVECRLQSSD